jgi:hypothetical protein
MYWLNVTTPQAEGAEGAPPPIARRASYVTTLEVLAP